MLALLEQLADAPSVRLHVRSRFKNGRVVECEVKVFTLVWQKERHSPRRRRLQLDHHSHLRRRPDPLASLRHETPDEAASLRSRVPV